MKILAKWMWFLQELKHGTYGTWMIWMNSTKAAPTNIRLLRLVGQSQHVQQLSPITMFFPHFSAYKWCVPTMAYMRLIALRLQWTEAFAPWAAGDESHSRHVQKRGGAHSFAGPGSRWWPTWPVNSHGMLAVRFSPRVFTGLNYTSWVSSSSSSPPSSSSSNFMVASGCFQFCRRIVFMRLWRTSNAKVFQWKSSSRIWRRSGRQAMATAHSVPHTSLLKIQSIAFDWRQTFILITRGWRWRERERGHHIVIEGYWMKKNRQKASILDMLGSWVSTCVPEPLERARWLMLSRTWRACVNPPKWQSSLWFRWGAATIVGFHPKISVGSCE